MGDLVSEGVDLEVRVGVQADIEYGSAPRNRFGLAKGCSAPESHEDKSEAQSQDELPSTLRLWD